MKKSRPPKLKLLEEPILNSTQNEIRDDKERLSFMAS